MAQLSWGKPTIEFGKCVNGATPSEWTKLGCDPVESSCLLYTSPSPRDRG